MLIIVVRGYTLDFRLNYILLFNLYQGKIYDYLNTSSVFWTCPHLIRAILIFILISYFSTDLLMSFSYSSFYLNLC